MKMFLRVVGRVAVAAAVLVAVSCIPLVPVMAAPVVPEPNYQLTVVSIQRLFFSPHFVGMHFQAIWATFPALIGLAAVAVINTWRLGRLVSLRG